MSLKHIVLLICYFPLQATAQGASYLRIQADKENPFDIKIEGHTIPCAANCLIPGLSGKSAEFDVVYRQGVYPNQHFTVLLPGTGHRSFSVTIEGAAFSLYDQDQHFYIPAGNTLAQDHLSAEHIPVKTIPPPQTPAASQAAAKPAIIQSQLAETHNSGSAAPKFIDDISLSNSHTIQKNTTLATGNAPEPVKKVSPLAITSDTLKPAKKPVSIVKKISLKPVPKEKTVKTAPLSKIKPAPAKVVAAPAIAAKPATKPAVDTTEYEDSTDLVTDNTAVANKDCPNPMDGNRYDNLYLSAKQKADNERLSFLSANLKYCFSCNQVSLLAKALVTDEQRYTFLKNVYTHVSDQYNFNTLEELLNGTEWKAKFRAIQK